MEHSDKYAEFWGNRYVYESWKKHVWASGVMVISFEFKIPQ